MKFRLWVRKVGNNWVFLWGRLFQPTPQPSRIILQNKGQIIMKRRDFISSITATTIAVPASAMATTNSKIYDEFTTKKDECLDFVNMYNFCDRKTGKLNDNFCHMLKNLPIISFYTTRPINANNEVVVPIEATKRNGMIIECCCPYEKGYSNQNGFDRDISGDEFGEIGYDSIVPIGSCKYSKHTVGIANVWWKYLDIKNGVVLPPLLDNLDHVYEISYSESRLVLHCSPEELVGNNLKHINLGVGLDGYADGKFIKDYFVSTGSIIDDSGNCVECNKIIEKLLKT